MAPDMLELKSSAQISNWNVVDGYDESRDFDFYPYRALGSGKQHRVEFLLKVMNQDVDYVCGGPFQGYVILFHAPNEGPQEINQFFRLSLGRSVLFTISPKLTVPSANICGYKPSDRHCLINSEKRLRFYKHYTLHNCQVECIANFTLAKCDCVPFAMPSKRHVSS